MLIPVWLEFTLQFYEPLCGSGSEGSKGSARFQRTGSEGVVSPLRGDEFLYAACRRQKPSQPGFARGNAPLLVLRTTFPPKGELYSPLSIGTHKHPNGKRR